MIKRPVHLALMLLLAGLAWLPSMRSGIVSTASFVLGLIMMDALTERVNDVPSVYAAFYRRGWLGRLALGFLAPGWVYGFFYTVILVVVAVCSIGVAGGREAALDAVAWWSGNSKNQTHPVGQKQANAWGLHDMLGNVWEWCSDGMRKYSSEPAADPVGPVHGDHRVFRGGSWIDDARDVRAAYRNANHPGDRNRVLGFRLARGQD